ncbi:alpha-2-antiplasmin isoform X2 [Xenopus laevis]|uniref:Alpha-2-antiplasmin isoform X2 n=2 Tax=Xenopus laevis TaxID=8355 RepID=A0A8J0UCP7_XENLA|nr:alpha-2-antiplasmin isoform X2 [Xenopus laevis]
MTSCTNSCITPNNVGSCLRDRLGTMERLLLLCLIVLSGINGSSAYTTEVPPDANIEDKNVTTQHYETTSIPEDSTSDTWEDLHPLVTTACRTIDFETTTASDSDNLGSEDKLEEGSDDKLEEGSDDKLEEGSDDKLEEGPEDKLEEEPEDKLEEGPEDKLEEDPLKKLEEGADEKHPSEDNEPCKLVMDDNDDDNEVEQESCDENASLEEMRKFSQAITSFSIDLLKEIDPESQKPSAVMSPFSIALGLLQLSLGAGKEMQDKLMETLHVESLHCLHNKLKTVRKELTTSILRTATRIYLKKGFQIKKSFLKRSEKWYGSKPMNLASKKKQNLDSINKWVKDVTEGQIPHFLSDLPQNVALILLNAMHFKGIWKNTFDPSLTSEEIFYINDDVGVPVEMMSAQKYPFSWFYLDGIEGHVAKLQFKGNMSFVILMPFSSTWNLSKLLANFNQSDLYSRFPKEKASNLKMPKLNLDYKLELNEALTNLGLGQLFTNPDLSGITNEPLFVSSIQHQSSLELNEEGVEASAATAVMTSRSHSVFRINRPFIFFLFEDTMGLPLFMGQVRDPSSGYQKKSSSKDKKNFNNGFLPK